MGLVALLFAFAIHLRRKHERTVVRRRCGGSTDGAPAAICPALLRSNRRASRSTKQFAKTLQTVAKIGGLAHVPDYITGGLGLN